MQPTKLQGATRLARQVARSFLVSVAPFSYWKFRGWRRGVEEPELDLLPVLCSRSRTSIDVGANFGMYTVRLAALSRGCIAFEPIPALARALSRGFGKRVRVNQTALSDRSGTTELRVPALHTGYSTIDVANRLTSRQAAHIQRLEVAIARLDDFELTDVGFIKIDVEGHEEAVLRGAEATLARCRPNLLVEVEDRHNDGCVRRLLAWMEERRYGGFCIVHGSLHDLAELDLSMHQATTAAEHYARNVVFLPNERRNEIRENIATILRRTATAHR